MKLKPRRVEIPYEPRPQFLPFHQRTQRWGCLVAHRRAGKTVAAINDLIKSGTEAQDRNALYGYIAPFRAQAKAVAWEYLKWYARPVTRKVNESDLIVTLVTNAEIHLYGADNADALRGVGFNGLLMDEYGDFKPSVWGSVIRPTLSDKQGWAVFMGTPKGKNQFWEIFDQAQSNPLDWFLLRLKASESGLLPATELAALRAQLSDDQYMQEMETSFEAAILGAFYGVEMREASEAGRITAVGYDPALSTYTAWDLGYRDDTAIWWFQVVRGEIHLIDFYAVSGASIPDITKLVIAKPYHYSKHFLPHDARAKTLASNRSIVEQLGDALGLSNLAIVPNLSVQDGIQAARKMLPRCWFDAVKCKDGIEALRQYQREWNDDKKVFRESALHNWASHPSDAFRMVAVSWKDEQPAPKVYPERALVVGPGNTATIEDMWAAAKKPRRIQRI